jgi:Heavy metal binding domain
MRLTALLWLIGICVVCASARSDQTGPADVTRAAAAPPTSAPLDPSKDPVYVCPMDPDVRSHNPGTCRRCGMNLVAGIPDPVEFHFDLDVVPRSPRPNQPAALQFMIHDPWKDRPVTSYNVVHEKLFHAFVVSEDLQFFRHAHPTFVADGVFQLPITFPKAGMFRVLGDFYPAGATPQLATQTIFVPGTAPEPVQLARDYSPKSSENMRVSLVTIPEQAVAGMRTQLRFTIDPAEGLEKYLGAWAHMLAASNDLIDMIHQHPFRVDEQQMVEFELVFPRPQVYRMWVQFQRKGVVNTVRFDVPVSELR